MKVGILAGGFGSRLSEETEIRPKPMVEIGSMPIIWHIMMHYHHYGYRDFCIALGYKGEYIKRWFHDYTSLNGSMVVRTATGEIVRHQAQLPDWSVHLVDTGLQTKTGGRIKRLADWIDEDTFMLTWGDGVSNVDLTALLAFHKRHGKLVTMTAVRPPARYGYISFDGDRVSQFDEKSQVNEGWINGAFFVVNRQACDYIESDDVMFEHAPMNRLAADGQLMAFRHEAFWQCMDTLREKQLLQNLWDKGNAPWKTWS